MLAMAIVCFWLMSGLRASKSWRQSFIALAVLIAVLFPVISVSDDLYAVNNPAETDTCQRRVHSTSCLHPFFPSVAALPALAPAERSLGVQSSVLLPKLTGMLVFSQAINTIESRPPPVF